MKIAQLGLVFSLCLLVACGGKYNSPSTVQAASGFTVASLNGSYAFGVTGASSGVISSGVGVATADGSGNVTNGDETINIGGTICHFTFSGTYSVNSNGTGSATINEVPDAPSISRGCVGGAGQEALAIGNTGNTLIFTSVGADPLVATAVKQ